MRGSTKKALEALEESAAVAKAQRIMAMPIYGKASEIAYSEAKDFLDARNRAKRRAEAVKEEMCEAKKFLSGIYAAKDWLNRHTDAEKLSIVTKWLAENSHPETSLKRGRHFVYMHYFEKGVLPCREDLKPFQV
jgi:hypothetical protein